MAVSFNRPVPILRIFSIEKAREFYIDYLGFQVDWEHTFESGMPVYMQVSRGGIVFHLSEHHGDGSPGSAVFIEMAGLQEFHAELAAKNYKYLRPGILEQEWGMREVHLIDPFGNKLRFAERMR